MTLLILPPEKSLLVIFLMKGDLFQLPFQMFEFFIKVNYLVKLNLLLKNDLRPPAIGHTIP